MDSKLDKHQEEARTKHKFEQGEESRTVAHPNEKMKKLFETITTVENKNQEKITQHATGYFHQVTMLLQTLTNAVALTKLLE